MKAETASGASAGGGGFVPPGRIPALDGLRGVAILLVLVWHYVSCQVVTGPGGFLPGLLSVMWSGVDLFFVLSGFLIVGILLDSKGAPGYFRTFYLRRVCRIMPLYYLVLILFVVLPRSGLPVNDWLFSPALPLWSYFTFTQNFFMHHLGFGPNWLGVTWSLAVEEQFYLVIPLLVWGLGRRSLAVVFAVGIMLAPVWRLLVGNLGAYVFPFARADAILWGGLLALLARWRPLPRSRALMPWLVLLVIGLVILLGKHAGVGDVYLHGVLGPFYGIWLLLALQADGSALGGVLGGRLLVWLGRRSYGIYLFHQPVNGLVQQWLTGRQVPGWDGPGGWTANLLSLVILVAVSELSFRYFEAPFLRYAHRRSRALPTGRQR